MSRQTQASSFARNHTSAVQIVEKVGGKYKLDTVALQGILERNNALNKKVAILSVAGAFREGKSFFLSNCVRYLQCKNSREDWMSDSASVTGFTWRRSAESVTEGILMWPEPFIVKKSNGEEIAVLLMDTEGAFDHKSSKSQCATIFALSALLSSVLVYNVMKNIREDTLEHLQFFASYGSYALEKGENESPFQSLFFLIRDWQNDEEFGLDAGQKHFKKNFEDYDRSNKAMNNLRRDIKQSFPVIKCALLPEPGTKITRGSEEKSIKVNDMDPDFKRELSKVIPHLIDNQATPKEIGGEQITGAELLTFFNTYVKIFASGKVPEPKSIFDATAEATHQSALIGSLEHYTTTMRAKFSELSDGKFFNEEKLQSIHKEVSNAAIKMFEGAKKMGSLPEFIVTLTARIEELFKEEFLKDNKNRIKIDREKKQRLEQEETARAQLAQKEREKEELRKEAERERQAREADAERWRRQMEQETREREAEKRRELERQLEEERRRREEAERQAQSSGGVFGILREVLGLPNGRPRDPRDFPGIIFN